MTPDESPDALLFTTDSLTIDILADSGKSGRLVIVVEPDGEVRILTDDLVVRTPEAISS